MVTFCLTDGKQATALSMINGMPQHDFGLQLFNQSSGISSTQ
jgi:hypothetical protein